VTAVYDANGNLKAEYIYDAWGNCTVTVDVDSIGTLNPIRYRGYYYDAETGFYATGIRYYDPAVGRFINADTCDALTAAPMSLTDKNLFSYCDNNPVIRKDKNGLFWDIIFDVVSLGFSIADVCMNPDDPWAWAGLAGDAIDLIPFVTGVGEVTRAVKTIDKVADVVDTTHDIAKTANRVENVIDTSTNSIRYTDKVLKQMNNAADLNHAFPSVIDTFVDINSGRPLKGGDGIMRILIELPGSVNNTPGIFEYIIEPNGMCNHRFFKELR